MEIDCSNCNENNKKLTKSSYETHYCNRRKMWIRCTIVCFVLGLQVCKSFVRVAPLKTGWQLHSTTPLLAKEASDAINKVIMVLFTENSLRYHDNPMLIEAEEVVRQRGGQAVRVCPLLYSPTDKTGTAHMPSNKMQQKLQPSQDEVANRRVSASGMEVVNQYDLLRLLSALQGVEVEAWYVDSSLQPVVATIDELEDVLYTASASASDANTAAGVKVRVFHDSLLPQTVVDAAASAADVKQWRYQGGRFEKLYSSLLRSSAGKGPNVPLPRMSYELLRFTSSQQLLGVVDEVRREEGSLAEDEQQSVKTMPGEELALKYIKDYLKLADDEAFSRKYLEDYFRLFPTSEKHSLSLQRLSTSTKHLFEGEVIQALLAPLLAQGCVSPRLLIHARSALLIGAQKWFTSRPLYCQLQALAIRRDWHALLARGMLQRQAQRQQILLDKLVEQDEDIRMWETSYPLWRGFTSRQAEMKSRIFDNKQSRKPMMFLIHGFGGSLDQYQGLASQLVKDYDVYALDSLGFGHCEKPPLSYNQYLWRDQIVDFIQSKCAERVNEEDGGYEEEAVPIVIAGNSIGGYSAASTAATFAKNNITVANPRTSKEIRIECQGLVLFNPSGELRSDSETSSRGDLELFPEYQGVRSDLLQLVGKGIFSLLQPRIEPTSAWLYPKFPGRVTEKSWYTDSVVDTILRDSSDPGASDVIAAGGKLPAPVTMNQLLAVYQGPVLIAQGILDPLNDAKSRALNFGKVRSLVDVELLELGHCPMDEDPRAIAEKITTWSRKHKIISVVDIKLDMNV